MKHYHVYILASGKNGTLYIGVTSNLLQRLNQHKAKQTDGFTKKYDVTKLVYYEEASDVNVAIWREKNLKSWKRDWKIALIEQENPEWQDLSKDL